jgi:hypothetical protein
MKYLTFCICFLVSACHQEVVKPTPKPDSDICFQMCQHIGPKEKGGLGCEEGNPVYDSDKPGPKDVPNESCEEFCKITQNNGVSINPKCILLVKTCDQIEFARTKNPNICELGDLL